MSKKNRSAFSLLESSMVLIIIALIVVVVLGGAKLVSLARLTTAQSLTVNSPVGGVPNLELWLESTLPNSFIASEMNSGSISTWYDINPQNNSKNNASQLTPTNQPIYTSGIINGLPAVFFSSASNNGMTISTNLNVTGDNTVFIVFGGTSSSLRSLQANGGGTNWLIGSWSGTVAYYANGWVYNSTALTKNISFYVVDGVRNSSGSTFYINGKSVANVSSNTPPGNLALGASGNYNEPMNGYIGEVIVFTRAISDIERQDIENYLSRKWRIKFY